MKKWFKFFFLNFFSHKSAREGAKRGYTNVFVSFILALMFLWASFIGSDMLPFATHYGASHGFRETAYAIFANEDAEGRIYAEIENGRLRAKKHGGEYSSALLVSTLTSDNDKRYYAQNGYTVIIDTRPATALAEIEAYCVSNDGKGTEISYSDYLTLSEVARLNFDFKLRYTGNELKLSDEAVEGYRQYVMDLSEESRSAAEAIAKDLTDKKITREEYGTKIYELYFVNYYPSITAYETTSRVPLLRNYYYHEFISSGADKYLLIFDDYMAASFEARGGNTVSFYGFYGNMENGAFIPEGAAQDEANAATDSFIKSSFAENWFLNVYAHLVNTVTLMPFIALMLLVAALLSYSVLKLCATESISSFGAMIKIVGSFAWFSGLTAALISVILAFFVNHAVIGVLPTVLFFAVLIARSVIFIIKENKLYIITSEQRKALQTEE